MKPELLFDKTADSIIESHKVELVQEVWPAIAKGAKKLLGKKKPGTGGKGSKWKKAGSAGWAALKAIQPDLAQDLAKTGIPSIYSALKPGGKGIDQALVDDEFDRYIQKVQQEPGEIQIEVEIPRLQGAFNAGYAAGIGVQYKGEGLNVKDVKDTATVQKIQADAAAQAPPSQPSAPTPAPKTPPTPKSKPKPTPKSKSKPTPKSKSKP